MKILSFILLLTLLLTSCGGTDKNIQENDLISNKVDVTKIKELVEKNEETNEKQKKLDEIKVDESKKKSEISEQTKQAEVEKEVEVEVEVERVITEREKINMEKIKIIKSEQSFLLINKLINDNKIEEAKKIIEKDDLSDFVTLKIQAKIAFGEKNYEEALKNEIEVNKVLKWVDYNELYFLGVIYDNLGEKEKSKKYISKSLEINKDFKLAKEYLDNLTVKK